MLRIVDEYQLEMKLKLMNVSYRGLIKVPSPKFVWRGWGKRQVSSPISYGVPVQTPTGNTQSTSQKRHR